MTSAITLPSFRATSSASPGSDSALQLAAACRHRMMPKRLSSSKMGVSPSEGEGAPLSPHTCILLERGSLRRHLPCVGLTPQYRGLSWRRNSSQGFEVMWAAPSPSIVPLPLHMGASRGSEVLFSHSRYSSLSTWVTEEGASETPGSSPCGARWAQIKLSFLLGDHGSEEEISR